MIKIDSELGKRIALTSDKFDNATIWDGRPKALYVTQLAPRGDIEANLREFFALADKIYTPIELTAQPEYINKIAAEYGYDSFVDVAGTPYMSNAASKFLKDFQPNVSQNNAG